MQWRPRDSEDSQDVSRLCDRSEAVNLRSKPCWQLFIDRLRYWIASQSCHLQFQEYLFHKWIQPEPFPLIIFYQNFPQLCRPMSSRRRRKGKNLTSSYVKSSWLRVFACFHRCHVTLTVTLGEGSQSCTAAEVMWAQHRCLRRHLARLTFSSGHKDAALVNVGCSATLKSGSGKKKP